MPTYMVLARTEREGLEVARAYGLSPAIYPMHPEEAMGYPEVVAVYVDGWEHSRQVAEVAYSVQARADETLEVPTTDHLRYGPERAARAADSLARIRDAKRHGSPFLEVVSAWEAAGKAATDAGRPVMDRLAHWMHCCPTRMAGLPCAVPPGTCRWP